MCRKFKMFLSDFPLPHYIVRVFFSENEKIALELRTFVSANTTFFS